MGRSSLLGALVLPLLAASVMLGSASASMGVERIVGGTPIQVQAAPWSVFVVNNSTWHCTGIVIDASHILTAAHCLYFDDKPPVALPSQLAVEVGVSNAFSPAATDAEQQPSVASFQIHPGFNVADPTSADDIAVLTLSTSLDLSGSAVQTVALPAANAPYPTGAAGTVAGYGFEQLSAPQSAGVNVGILDSMSVTVDSQGVCGSLTHSAQIEDDNATELCATSSPTSSPCDGDSGAGLVEQAAPARCSSGSCWTPLTHARPAARASTTTSTPQRCSASSRVTTTHQPHLAAQQRTLSPSPGTPLRPSAASSRARAGAGNHPPTSPTHS